MKQNKYDEPDFFARYSAMARSTGGLAEAGEWDDFRSLLPALRGKRVLDLGCGFGWHCRYAREQGAEHVVGVDLSERMLVRARELTDDPAIEYRRGALEDIDFVDEAFDVVISSLALHYVARFDQVCGKVHRCLTPGGAFVFSVEHPIFTARAEQDWHYAVDGTRMHWPVDGYHDEGIRHARWMVDDVVKYHRTVATYVNALIEAGFQIARILESKPPQKMSARADMKDELRRPMFLLVAATKPAD